MLLMTSPAALTLTAHAGRLDSVLSELSGVSRSQVSGWIEAGRVRVGGSVVPRGSHRLRGGETLEIDVPPPADSHVEAEHIPLDVIYEDDALIAVNKPPGMVTHPAPGVVSGTLVNALLGRMALPAQDGFEEGGSYRPGIVHRLDKDTSGVIVVAKTVEDHARLSHAFKERETRKTYLAIAAGQWKAQGPVQVDAPIGRHTVARQRMTVGGAGAREAQTLFTPLAAFPDGHGAHAGAGSGTAAHRAHAPDPSSPAAPGQPDSGRHRLWAAQRGDRAAGAARLGAGAAAPAHRGHAAPARPPARRSAERLDGPGRHAAPGGAGWARPGFLNEFFRLSASSGAGVFGAGVG